MNLNALINNLNGVIYKDKISPKFALIAIRFIFKNKPYSD